MPRAGHGARRPAAGAGRDTWRLPRRVTYIIDRSGRVRLVDAGGLALDTGRTLQALTRLAHAS